MNQTHVLVTAMLGVATICCTGLVLSRKEPIGEAAATELRVEGELPALGGAREWLNSPPLGAGALRGKVVVVDFWTYTCINWRRSLPYVRAWAEKYAAQGLVVIGVHTPEFGFERDIQNVRWAAKNLNVRVAPARAGGRRYAALRGSAPRPRRHGACSVPASPRLRARAIRSTGDDGGRHDRASPAGDSGPASVSLSK